MKRKTNEWSFEFQSSTIGVYVTNRTATWLSSLPTGVDMVHSDDPLSMEAQSLASLRPTDKQLGLASIFWVTDAAAMLLTYAQKIGPVAIQQLIAYTVFVVIASSMITLWTKRWNEAFYWSALYALLGFLAIAGSSMVNPNVAYGWGVVGAACGAIASASFPRNLFLSAVVSGCIGLAGMWSVIFFLGEKATWLVVLDVIGAMLVGVGLKPLTEIIRWAEHRSGKHRIVLASWLAMSVIVGNLLVPILAGVQR
jgi:hypothetical protein